MFLGAVKLLGVSEWAPRNAETVRVNGATKASACGWKHHVMASILQQGSERRKVRRISRNLNEVYCQNILLSSIIHIFARAT